VHELSLCQGLIGIIEEEAVRQQFSRVTRVRLEVGCLAAVEPQAMSFAFEVARQGTVCDGAELVMLDVPGKGWCFDCQTSVDVTDRLGGCPACGGARIQVTGGDELKIRDLEVR
jgi:hydrogenase nickel incorporation protein HypA/HybF